MKGDNAKQNGTTVAYMYMVLNIHVWREGSLCVLPLIYTSNKSLSERCCRTVPRSDSGKKDP